MTANFIYRTCSCGGIKSPEQVICTDCMIVEAKLVARKARHATRAINLLLDTLHRPDRSVQHGPNMTVPLIGLGASTPAQQRRYERRRS